MAKQPTQARCVHLLGQDIVIRSAQTAAGMLVALSSSWSRIGEHSVFLSAAWTRLGFGVHATVLEPPQLKERIAGVKSVRINKNWTLLDTLLRRKPRYLLLVSTGAEAGPVTVCETQDAAFMERIGIAMDLAAAKAGGTRGP